MSAEASPALLDLSAAVDKVICEDPLVLDPRQQVADLGVLMRTRIAADYATYRSLRAAHHSDALSQVEGRPVRDWLVEDWRVPRALANRFWFLLRFLDDFPLTEAAFAECRISMDHASTVLHALLTLPRELREIVERLLLEACDELTPREVADFVDELLQGLGHDKESDVRRERRYAQRGVDFNAVAHKTYAMSGTLMPEVAEVVKLALSIADGSGTEEDMRTPRQRWHDALGIVARFFLDHADVPQVNGERPRLVITIRREDLDAAPGVAALATLGSGARIPVETARRLACDAGVLPVVLGGKSEVLDIGRATRDFSQAIRRAAMIQQDNSCAFPRCRRKCVELHHILWWSKGGKTSLDNAAWLCAFHHWLVHEGKWQLRRDDCGFTFTSPHGDARHRCLSAA